MPYPRRKHTKRLIRTILLDLLALGVCLNGFAYFHHVRVKPYTPKTLATPAAAAPTATPAATAAPEATSAAGETAPEPTQEAVDTGLLGGRYAEKFTSGGIEQTEDSYRSANVSVEMSRHTAGTESRPVVYYVADIYVKDITSFRTALAFEYAEQNEGARKNVMSTLQLSELTNAVVAISGDNFTFRKSGLIAIRNGVEWFNSTPLADDICVLYYDGTMETYEKGEVNSARIEEIYARQPYQIWTFGPELLIDGEVNQHYADAKPNPLSGIGYFEPGHYCFVLVDGRQAGYSWGLNLTQFSEVFKDLGCTAAYNLDGGDTAVMTFDGAWRSQPQDEAPRETSDILYIGEPLSAASGE